MKKIGIHLFDLQSPSGRDITGLLRRIARIAKAERWRLVSSSQIGLQDTRFDAHRNLWLLDFVKRRPIGPGRVRVNGEIQGFDLADGEDFGEETAALFDPQRGWLMVEFNQHGARAGSIVEYLNGFDHDPESDLQVEARLDHEAEVRLGRQGIISKVALKIRTSPQISALLRQHGGGLGDALERAARGSDAEYLDIELSVGRRRNSRLAAAALALTRRLAQLADGHDVKKLRVSAKPDEAGHAEVFDLLRHRIKNQYSSDDLVVVGRRYTQDSRWRALLRVHAGWAQEFD